MMRQAASLGPLLEKRQKAIEARLAAGLASRIGYRNGREYKADVLLWSEHQAALLRRLARGEAGKRASGLGQHHR